MRKLFSFFFNLTLTKISDHHVDDAHLLSFTKRITNTIIKTNNKSIFNYDFIE